MKIPRLFFAILLAGTFWFQACAIPAWVNTVEADAAVAAPIAASLIAVVDPALTPTVTLIENGFNALLKTLETYKSTPTTTNLQAVQSAFTAINTNVAELESAAQIKTAPSQDTVASIIELLAQAVSEISALVPPEAGLAVTKSISATPAVAIAKGWKAQDFKREYNNLVKGDPRFKPLA